MTKRSQKNTLLKVEWYLMIALVIGLLVSFFILFSKAEDAKDIKLGPTYINQNQ